MFRLSVAILALVSLSPVAAGAATRSGAYSGTSFASVETAQGTSTDTGKVTFKVERSKVKNFHVKGQQFSCNLQAFAFDISPTANIKLDNDGRGKLTYDDPNAGPFIIKIVVRTSGKASGSVTARGLCEGTAHFSAKRS